MKLRFASKSEEPSRARRWRRWMGRSGLVLLGLAAVLYALCTGPRDRGRYPEREGSPYRLPWPARQTWFCGQSNRGVVSHRGWEEYAYDFNMPVNSEVSAARGGVVTRVVVRHDGHGLRLPNNFIAIDHGDGTVGWYLHLQKDGSLVRPGERVRQGQIIARSGHVGRSLAPHLHFQVTDAARKATLPITFADVEQQRGIPRMFFFYTSGNTVPRAEVKAAVF